MYRLARRHRPVTPVPAQVTFRRLELLAYADGDLEIEAQVSAGTYLRSFAHDLGQVLGCGAHLHSLRRIAAGPFRVEGALDLSTIEALGPALAERRPPLDEGLLGMPTLRLTNAGVPAARHGRPCGLGALSTPPPIPPGRCRLQGPEGRLIAI